MSDAHDTEARRLRLQALAVGLFDDRVSIGVARIGAAEESLFPVEAEAIAAAVPSRRAEFAAGRAAAREAMGARLPIPMCGDRAPAWPPGVAGSISHAQGWAIAATSRHWARIGLDIEHDVRLATDLLHEILRPEERAIPEHQSVAVFCIKECVFKASYPSVRQIFGFDAVSVRLDGAPGEFRATFQIDLPPFQRGESLGGRYLRGEGFVLAGTAS